MTADDTPAGDGFGLRSEVREMREYERANVARAEAGLPSLTLDDWRVVMARDTELHRGGVAL